MGDDAHGRRLHGLIVVLWRAGCASKKGWRSQKPISITDAARCSCAVAKAGVVAKSAWTRGGGTSYSPGSSSRAALPVGPLFCVLGGRTRGRQWSTAAARAELRRTAAAAGVRRRFAPHQLRRAHAVEMAREGVPLVVIQRQLGHRNLGITRSTSKGSTTPRSSTPSTPARADDPGQHVASALTDRRAAHRAKQHSSRDCSAWKGTWRRPRNHCRFKAKARARPQAPLGCRDRHPRSARAEDRRPRWRLGRPAR